MLRVVLSHSRKGYSQAVFRETTKALIECLEEAFRHFGGIPRTVPPPSSVPFISLLAIRQSADWTCDQSLRP